MAEKEKPEGETPVPRAAIRLRPYQLIPSRLFAFFFIMECWVFVLYLTGAGEGWPDAGLSLLTEYLSILGILSFVSAMLGIVFDIAETLIFKRVFFLRFAVVYLVLGVAGLALGIVGSIFQIAAAGRLPKGVL
ncbi:MAG: hypothetical protein LBK61_10400 [Spirochaetaceae bacterium]|jgi:hypothetical protein|nr:hypothetical protein [Spirochaetaceae bacterium]